MRGPSPLRIGAACLAAAGAAATPTLLLGGLAILAFPFGLMVAGAHVLLFGLPAYLVMRARWEVDWPQALIAGFLIGSIPLSVWQLLLAASSGPLSFSMFLFILTGFLGAVGGAVFRAVVGPPVDPAPARETASIFE